MITKIHPSLFKLKVIKILYFLSAYGIFREIGHFTSEQQLLPHKTKWRVGKSEEKKLYLELTMASVRCLLRPVYSIFKDPIVRKLSTSTEG